jgi:hypothetical protein
MMTFINYIPIYFAVRPQRGLNPPPLAPKVRAPIYCAAQPTIPASNALEVVLLKFIWLQPRKSDTNNTMFEHDCEDFISWCKTDYARHGAGRH